MDFIEHNNHDDLSIESYAVGVIEVNAQHYQQAIFINNHAVVALDMTTPQDLNTSVLSELLQQIPKPELMVVGTGAKQQFLHPKLQVLFAQYGIGLEMMATAAACRTFNILRSENRKVWALLWPIEA